jgi:hypothetical protein
VESIRRIAQAARIEPVIAEDDLRTKELWDKITADIDRCDLFVADISSGSQNIAFELGYALARKPADRIGIFVARSATDPSDLRGYVLQKYGSLSEFESSLGAWLSEAAGMPVPIPTRINQSRVAYSEDFRDLDRFLRLWFVPPGAAFHLSGDGLKLGDAHLPVLTKQLGLVRDCEVEFEARIDRQQIGWTVLGTQDPQDVLPTFCVMFALRTDGRLVPHLWSARLPNPVHGGYHRYDQCSKKLRLSRDRHGWFTMITRVGGDRIQLIHKNRVVFDADLSKQPFTQVYRSVPVKQGNVGFRCFPGEEATITRVEIRERPATPPKRRLQPMKARRRLVKKRSRRARPRG